MTDLTKQLEKDRLSGQPVFYFSSKDINKNIDFVNKNKITYIRLNPVKAVVKLKDVDFLKEVKNLKRLDIVALPNVDISAISEITSLESLYLDANNTKNFDFGKLVNLGLLNFVYSNSMKGFFSLKSLKELIVAKADIGFLSISVFEKFKSLANLQLVQCKQPADMTFLQVNTKLSFLKLAYIREAFSLKGLDKLNLLTLEIENCKKVNLDALDTIKSLKSFSLIDSPVLENTMAIESLPKLEDLVVLGTSYFKTADLRGLKRKLKYLGVDDKKHYIV